MLTYVTYRVLYSVVVTVDFLFAVFVIARLSPIDPVKYILRQNSLVKGLINQVEYAAMRHQLGLDQPISNQFATYIPDVLHGNVGTSIINPG